MKNILKKKVFIILITIILYIILFCTQTKLVGALTLIGGIGGATYLYTKNENFKSKHIVIKILTGIAIFCGVIFFGIGGLFYNPVAVEKTKIELQAKSEETKKEDAEKAKAELQAKEEQIKKEAAEKAEAEAVKKAQEEAAKKAEEDAKKMEEESKQHSTASNYDTSSDNTVSSNDNSSNSYSGSSTSNSGGVTTYEPAQGNRTVYWVSGGKSYHYDKNCKTLARSKNILEGPASNCPKTDPCNVCVK